jgi:hypothetical protein
VTITITTETKRSTKSRIRLAVATTLAVASLAAVAGLGAHTPSREAGERAEMSNQAEDHNVTRGKDQGSVTQTPNGMPPASQQAKPRPATEDAEAVPAPKKRTDHDEIEENSNRTSTKQLKYAGGAVQTAPRIYLVLLGNTWGTTSGDPNGVANRLHYFYGALGGSGVNNTMKQYGGSTGSFTNPTSQYMGWIKDTTALTSRPSSQDIANAAARAAIKVNDFSYNAQFVVATPWGVMDQYSVSARACAWHYWTQVSGHSGWITYTSLPYTPYLDSNVYNCGGRNVNAGSAGVLDGVTINAIHEYAESVNDPGLNGWKDSDGSENADKCSWTNLANMKMANGSVFPVQPTWNNQFRNTYGDGCLFSA